jgi:hypothetical protein
MDAVQARNAAIALLSASPPSVPDAVLLEGEEDHGWCYVINWTTERAVASLSFEDVAPPGIGPIAIDKESGDAFYLGSQSLPRALEAARRCRGR